jgi:hypothetical protein
LDISQSLVKEIEAIREIIALDQGITFSSILVRSLSPNAERHTSRNGLHDKVRQEKAGNGLLG